MDIQKAIECLEMPLKHIQCVHKSKNGMCFFAYSSDLVGAFETAINAIQKQIPKKPIFNGSNWYKCPNGCEIHKKSLGRDYFCPNCGQALDWSEDESEAEE